MNSHHVFVLMWLLYALFYLKSCFKVWPWTHLFKGNLKSHVLEVNESPSPLHASFPNISDYIFVLFCFVLFEFTLAWFCSLPTEFRTFPWIYHWLSLLFLTIYPWDNQCLHHWSLIVHRFLNNKYIILKIVGGVGVKKNMDRR